MPVIVPRTRYSLVKGERIVRSELSTQIRPPYHSNAITYTGRVFWIERTLWDEYDHSLKRFLEYLQTLKLPVSPSIVDSHLTNVPPWFCVLAMTPLLSSTRIPLPQSCITTCHVLTHFSRTSTPFGKHTARLVLIWTTDLRLMSFKVASGSIRSLAGSYLSQGLSRGLRGNPSVRFSFKSTGIRAVRMEAAGAEEKRRCAIITGVARPQGIGRHLVYGFMKQVSSLVGNELRDDNLGP